VWVRLMFSLVRTLPSPSSAGGPLAPPLFEGFPGTMAGNGVRSGIFSFLQTAKLDNSPKIKYSRPDPVPRSPVALSPESHLHHAELRAMVDGVLGTLSPREREAIDLYLAGIQIGEIATLLHPERYQNIALSKRRCAHWLYMVYGS
jgi:hypothetical protein